MRKYLLLIFVLIVLTVALGFTTQIVTLQGPKPDWIRYYSPNKQYCFEFIPSYSKQTIDSVDIGTFYKIEGKSLEKIWSMKVAPALVLLPNSGQYIVIFNTWMPKSLDENIVSIYDKQGHLIKGLTVKDIIGDNEIYRLPIMELYPFFGQGHYIDNANNCLVLDIIFDVPLFHYHSSVRREHIEYRYYLEIGNTIAESATQCYFPYSQIKPISPDGLTLSQIDLAMAEIYLRHCQVLNDTSIQQLVTQKIWYSRNDNLSGKPLGDIEKKNIEKLQSLKKRYKTYFPDTIVFNKPFGDNYIIYTGSVKIKPYRYCMYICPKLCNLDDLDEVKIGKVLVDDASASLKPEQVEIRNINTELKNESKSEILINREGPSDDYSQICLGFDDKENIIRYYLIWGKVKEFETVERDITFIKTIKLMSYYARYDNYIFNSTSFALAKLDANEFYITYLNTPDGRRTTMTTTLRPLEVFPGRWLHEWQGSERYIIPAGDTLRVEKYSIGCGGMFLIKHENQYAWATEEDIKKSLNLIHTD